MLKNADLNYAINYKMSKVQMLQTHTELKSKDNKKYKKIKACLRMQLLNINQSMYDQGEQQFVPNAENMAYEQNIPQMNYQFKGNHCSGLRHQQYLISLKHAYDQYVTNLANAEHMRMLESGLSRMQKLSESHCINQ
jgi:hypothetical protein